MVFLIITSNWGDRHAGDRVIPGSVSQTGPGQQCVLQISLARETQINLMNGEHLTLILLWFK